MKTIIIYVSKTGNTKHLAEVMAKEFRTTALPLNLMGKKGRGTKEEREQEKRLYRQALVAGKDADAVILGTPTSFQKAHSKILRFAKEVETTHAGVFCSHAQQLGTTLTDMETIFKERKLTILGSVAFHHLKPGQFEELEPSIKQEYLSQAKEFVSLCLQILHGGEKR